MDSLVLQGLIEDLPDEERPQQAPVPFDDFELPKLGAAREEHPLDENQPAKITPEKGWTDQQIIGHLQSEGRDAQFIDGYLSGWRKKPFK